MASHGCTVPYRDYALFTKSFKFFTAHIILFCYKKITSFSIDVMNAHHVIKSKKNAVCIQKYLKWLCKQLEYTTLSQLKHNYSQYIQYQWVPY